MNIKKSIINIGSVIANEVDSLIEDNNASDNLIFIQSEIYTDSLEFLKDYTLKCSLVLLSIKLGYYEGCKDV